MNFCEFALGYDVKLAIRRLLRNVFMTLAAGGWADGSYVAGGKFYSGLPEKWRPNFDGGVDLSPMFFLTPS